MRTNKIYHRITIGLICVFLLQTNLNGQYNSNTILFLDNIGDTLQHALTGGLNNPQFSNIDLNGDGVQDLVYFDRQSYEVVPFLNLAGQLIFSPSYINKFPDLERWMLCRDFNCDGDKDIFAYKYDYSTGKVSITVYKNERDISGDVSFTLAKSLIEFRNKGQQNFYNLFHPSTDIPAVDDIDNDGDLDILSFNASGGYIDFYRNESVESGFACDSLLFVFEDNCWGRMYESGLTEFIDLSNSIDSCPSYPNWNPLKSARHSGSTLLTLDMDNDNDKELMLGDLSFKNINLLTNGGDTDTAFLINQEMFFPQNSINVNVDVFPAAFHVDVDNDGNKDLVVAPNIAGNAEDDECWLYTNTNNNQFPDFDFSTKKFLVEDMIDLGSGSTPILVDLNNDGLKDLLLANHKQFINPALYLSYLVYYENVGSAQQAIYQEIDTDFASLRQYNFERLVPSFGDLDADGDLDMVIGWSDGTLLYFENSGTVNSPSYPNFSNALLSGIDVGQNAFPQLFDIDDDADLDLIIGERNGNINLYLNDGDAQNPNFNSSASTETLGFIDCKLPGFLEGNSAPHFFRKNNSIQLLVGTESGEIWHFDNISGNVNGTYNRINGNVDEIDVGFSATVCQADLDQDGQLDLLLGNKRGGLMHYSSDITTQSFKIIDRKEFANVFPNPSEGVLSVELKDPSNLINNLSIFDLFGRLVFESKIYNSVMELDISDLSDAIYMIRIETEQGIQLKKLIKK